MPRRERVPVFTENDIPEVIPKETHKCIIKAEDISDDCLEVIIMKVFKQAKEDLKTCIEKLQALDMKEVRDIYAKKHVGIKLTKKENGVNMSYAAHYTHMRDIENFFTSEWAADLGLKDGWKAILDVDMECGYESTEERNKDFYVPTFLLNSGNDKINIKTLYDEETFEC